jgi:hypothetical protein
MVLASNVSSAVGTGGNSVGNNNIKGRPKKQLSRSPIDGYVDYLGGTVTGRENLGPSLYSYGNARLRWYTIKQQQEQNLMRTL